MRLILAAIGFTTFAGASPALAQEAIFFGDDRLDYAHDSACDDGRFIGEGVADILLTDDITHDATDCRSLFERNRIRLNPLFAEPSRPGAYDFGDDASAYAQDGACDDIRFVGPESSQQVYLWEDVGHDASDCRRAMEAGDLRWQGHGRDFENGVTYHEIMEEPDVT